MNPSSLNTLIVNSQFGPLQPGFFVPTVEDLQNEELREVFNRRIIQKQEPSDIYCSDINRTLFPSAMKIR